MLKENKGVTLVALVITIIVLLILAGVTLSMVMGDSGIFTKANKASEETNLASARDAIRLALLEVTTNNYNNDGSQKTAYTETTIVDEVNKQLTSVGEGYQITGGKVQKNSKDVKNNAGTALTATFKKTSNNAIIVEFNNI